MAEQTTNKQNAASYKKLYIIGIVILAAAVVAGAILFANLYNRVNFKANLNVVEGESYFSKDDVAAYIYKYGKLPDNYVNKNLASVGGWVDGNVEQWLPGKAIGGDYFFTASHREDLPDAPGRVYYECDVNTHGLDSRGTERLVYTNDGLVFYTGDNFQTFEQLY